MNLLYFFQDKIKIVAFIIVIVFSLSFHEFSHAFAANLLGDSTAKQNNRLTLNPLRHMNFLGTLCLIFFKFGWANPVPVNVNNFKKPRVYMALVSFAGPFSNLILVTLGFFLTKIYEIFLLGAYESYFVIFLQYFINYLIMINLQLFVFNLIPIPPLDGYRIFTLILPKRFYYSIIKYERFGNILILFLLWKGILNKILILFVVRLFNYFKILFNFKF